MDIEKLDPKISEKYVQKMEVMAKISELQAEVARINVDLAQLGASAGGSNCW